jgi:hypothetical protein
MEMWKRPNPNITNPTMIAERKLYRHQPRRSHRILEVWVQVIGRDFLLSSAQKITQTKEARGRVFVAARKDGDTHHVAVSAHYYEWTPAGFLIEVTHRYGGPVSYDSGSGSV